MNPKQKKIIVSSIKEAGNKIIELIGKTDKNLMNKVTSFDYGIPADKIAEKIILDAIRKSKLDCKIISEESEIDSRKTADYTVYLDPLDGSVNFSRGIPAFCIGLGIYQDNNEPVLGIVYDISVDELFIAEIGKEVTINGKPITPKSFESNILLNLEWFGAPSYEEIVTKLKKANLRARTAGSGVLALLYGCIGRGDGAILLANSPWDIAPGMVFAKELGCTIKQFSGEDVDLSIRRQSIIAAPKDIFEKIMNVIQ